MKKLTVTLSSLLLCAVAFAQSAGYYDAPYTRYEAEEASLGGGALIYYADKFQQTMTAAEASNQKYAGLPASGSFVQWTVRANEGGAGVTVRFTMPDASNGMGNQGGLSIYVNGVKKNVTQYGATSTEIPLSSYWSWQYFNGDQPGDTPGSNPRFRFDETHFILPSALAPGDIVKIQNDRGDFEYGVDFIEIEPVPGKITQPANSLSITDYGAVAGDGLDDYAAIKACTNAAIAQGKDIYIPEGRFEINQIWRLAGVSNRKITGAGIWYTNIHFSSADKQKGGISGEDGGSGAAVKSLEFCEMYISSMLRSRYGQQAVYKCFMDSWGTDSYIHDIWQEHFECGFWIGDYNSPYEITYRLLIEKCRIRNNLADGVNLCMGASDCMVTNCSVRNNGDDGLAMWNNNEYGAHDETNNTFQYNTIENNWRAGSIGIFGGNGHKIQYNYIKDGFKGSGMRFNTTFPGHKYNNTQNILVKGNIIVNCGTSHNCYNQEEGAIELRADGGAVKNITFEDNQICNTQRCAIQFDYGSGFSGIVFNNTVVDKVALDGETNSTFTGAQLGLGKVMYAGTGNGSVTFNTLKIRNVPQELWEFKLNGFNVTYNNRLDDSENSAQSCVCQTVAVTGITLLPQTADIAIGDQLTLQATVLPAEATNKNVNFEVVSGAAFATVSKYGIVTGLAAGVAEIQATTAEGGFSDRMTVTISSVPVQGVALEGFSLQRYETKTLQPVFTPANASNKTVIFSILSGDEFISLNAQTGAVTGMATGIATVQVTTEDGDKTATADIEVLPDPPCNCPTIARTDKAPLIDGEEDEIWTEIPSMPVSNRVLNQNGGGNMSGYKGSWRALYDYSRIYLLIDYAKPTAHSQFFAYDATGSNWWQGSDAIEIYFDGNNAKGTTYDSDDYQAVFIYDASPVAGSGSISLSGISSAWKKVEEGVCRIEVSIPWTNLKITPAEFKTIGFDLAVTVSQAASSTGRVAQFATYSHSDQMFANPSLFGNVQMRTCEDWTGPMSLQTYPQSLPVIKATKGAVSIANMKSGQYISLYNMQGKKLYSARVLASEHKITSLPSGVYIVALSEQGVYKAIVK